MTKPLRIGIVGASPDGSWGSVAHIPALKALAGFEVVAVSTSRFETAARTAATFAIPHAFDDPRRLAEHPDVDAVVVAVRVPEHERLVGLALEAGKHVYCEWPLGRTVEQACAMAAAAEAAGVTHMVGLQARYAPALMYVRDLVAEGAIGDLVCVDLVHSVPWTFRGRPSSAYLLDRLSGATFLTIPGGHSLDAICHLAGPPKLVRASLATISREAEEAGGASPSCDRAIISGVVGTDTVFSLRLEGASRFGTGARLEIGGTRGDLVVASGPGGRGIQMADLTVARTVGTGKLEPLDIPERYFGVPEAVRHNPMLNVAKAHRAFRDAILGGTRASPDFHEAVRLHRAIEAIQRSSDESRTIDVQTQHV